MMAWAYGCVFGLDLEDTIGSRNKVMTCKKETECVNNHYQVLIRLGREEFRWGTGLDLYLGRQKASNSSNNLYTIL